MSHTSSTLTRATCVLASALGTVVLGATAAHAGTLQSPFLLATTTASTAGCAAHVSWAAVPGADHYLAARTLPGLPSRQGLQQTQQTLPAAVRTYDVTLDPGTTVIVQVTAVAADGSVSGTSQKVFAC